MKRQWTDEELISHFTLTPKELDLIDGNKSYHNLLGFAVLMQRLSPDGRTSLDALLTVTLPEAQDQETTPVEPESPAEEEQEEELREPASPRPPSALHFLKQDAGPAGLASVLQEIAKLERIHQIGLSDDLFASLSAKTVESYRQ